MEDAREVSIFRLFLCLASEMFFTAELFGDESDLWDIYFGIVVS